MKFLESLYVKGDRVEERYFFPVEAIVPSIFQSCLAAVTIFQI